jgi:adenylosuccinate synthase
MNIDIVIGAGYGDEGKGATVNKLATEKSLVVRFNGGCQAGHTVEHNGVRHIFSHFGAGTLKGADTYLSSFFVCSPIAFHNERQALSSYGLSPEVFVSKDCLVSTPWDIFINRTLEDSRGNKKHGSVGVGFNETIERCQHEEFCLTIDDLRDSSNLYQKLKDIANKWIYKRADELDLDIAKPLTRWHFDIDAIWSLYCNVLSQMIVVDDEKQFMWDKVKKNHRHIVFEGAQGLMIDQTYGTFPYVTRSNCGLKNVIRLLPMHSCANITYVTRAYTTRHGIGPLPHEIKGTPPYRNIIDKTNLYNHYQGGLRFSYLNLDTLKYSIKRDLSDSVYYPSYNQYYTLLPAVHVTCLDQLDGSKILAILDDQLIAMSTEELYDRFLFEMGVANGRLNDE